MMLQTTLETLIAIAPMVDIPDVTPDTSHPVPQAIARLAAIVLGVGAILAVVGLAICAIMLIFGGASARLKEQATSGLIWCLVGVIALGSVAGLAAWAVNFEIF